MIIFWIYLWREYTSHFQQVSVSCLWISNKEDLSYILSFWRIDIEIIQATDDGLLENKYSFQQLNARTYKKEKHEVPMLGKEENKSTSQQLWSGLKEGLISEGDVCVAVTKMSKKSKVCVINFCIL